MRNAIVAWSLALALWACGKKSDEQASSAPSSTNPSSAAPSPAQPASSFGACDDIAKRSVCSEVVAKIPPSVPHDQICNGATWRQTCPTEGQVGACDSPAGAILHFYSTGPEKLDAVKAKIRCDEGRGKWLP
jgi:hypothetical protein